MTGLQGKNRFGKRSLVSIVLLLSLTPIASLLAAGNNVPLKAASGATTIAQVFLNDTFANGLDGWSYFGNPGYQLTQDTTTGQPAPSAHITGDAWWGNCSIHGMSKA